MFEMTADWWEVVVRVAVLYAFLLVLLRISGKREIGQLGPLELLTMLLISETVSPALTAEDASVTAAMIAAGTLLVLSILVAVATYASRPVERLIEGQPRRLVSGGTLDPAARRAERITDTDIAAALRKQGLRSLSQVEEATVEANGEITLIERAKQAPH